MQHIPDEDGQRLNIEVPYLNHGVEYDGLGWETFPARAGYPWMTSQHLTVQDIEKHVSPENEAQVQGLLQEWLYFGILKEVMGLKYDKREFLAASQDRLTSTITTDTVRSLSVQYEFSSQVPRDYQVLRVHRRLLAAMRTIALWDQFAVRRQAAWAVLSLSVFILGELLMEVTTSWDRPAKWRPSWDRPADWRPSLDAIPSYVHQPFINQRGASVLLIRRHLLQNSKAWCVHQVDNLCTKVSYTTLIYFTGIKRYERPGVDHANCGGRFDCAAFSIAPGQDFVTKHVEADCTCDHVEAPRAEQIRILERGGIPVVRCVREETGALELTFVPATPNSKYTAISHVWADGLGNPFNNGLPRCQLMRLIDDPRTTVSTSGIGRYLGFRRSIAHYFWLDVYCIPPQHASRNQASPQSQEQIRDAHLKKKAIARMGTTYAWAKQTLILDQELEHSRSLPSQPLRYRALAALCAWNGRCWTFQEYSFSRLSRLKFQDSIQKCDLSPTDWLGGEWMGDFEGPCRRIFGDIGSLGAPVNVATGARGYFSEKERSTPTFAIAWRSFIGRTTTQWDDMMEVLANLLGLNAGHLLRLDGTSRMKAILASQYFLPIWMLFAPFQRPDDGTPFEERWIPRTVQGVSPSNWDWIQYDPSWAVNGSRVTMRVTHKGLLLKADDVTPTPSFGSVRIVRLLAVGDRSRTLFELDCWLHESCEHKYSCWASLDATGLSRGRAHASQERIDEVILVLHIGNFLCGKDLSATFRGACLVPIAEASKNCQHVVYCGPFEWGVTANHSPMQLHGTNTNVSTAPGSTGLDLLIISDIASWPKLPQSRYRRFSFFKLYVSVLPAIVGLFLFCTGLWWIGYLASGELGHIWATLAIVPAFIILIADASICVVRYRMIHDTLSEVSLEPSWWRQMDAIFQVFPFKEFPWYRKPTVAFLRMIVWVIKLFAGVLRMIVWVIKLFARVLQGRGRITAGDGDAGVVEVAELQEV